MEINQCMGGNKWSTQQRLSNSARFQEQVLAMVSCEELVEICQVK